MTERPHPAGQCAGESVSSMMLQACDDAEHHRPLVPLNPAQLANNNHTILPSQLPLEFTSITPQENHRDYWIGMGYIYQLKLSAKAVCDAKPEVLFIHNRSSNKRCIQTPLVTSVHSLSSLHQQHNNHLLFLFTEINI